MEKKEFFRFLKENGAYPSCINYIKKDWKSPNEFIDHFIKGKRPHEILVNGFSWSDTKQGGEFWNALYKKLWEFAYE